MEVKVKELDGSMKGWLEIYVEFQAKPETLLLSSISFYSKKDWSDKDLNIEAKKLSDEYTKKTKETLSINYFKKFNLKLIEKYNKLELNKSIYYLDRLQSFMTYHIKTLRSIGKLENKESMIRYIERELVGLTGVKLESFHDILDTITEKRKSRKEKNEQEIS